MLKYRGKKLIRTGFMGVVLAILIVLVGLSPETLTSMATAIRYQAQFSDAGGMTAGNDVTIAGIKVGSVSDVSLQGRNALVTFAIDSTVELGSDTTAHVRTGTLLGERVLTLESAGDGTMHPMDVIPVSRTASPYSLTEAVSELTTNTAGTDTASLNQSLDTLSETLDQVAPQLGPAFDGITKLSQAINDRDDTLGALLKDGADVTKILSDRSAQVNTLILNANDLVGVLNERRYAIVELLAHTSALAKQLSGLIHDNEAEAGTDVGQAQCGDGDTGEEPRQHRQGAAGAGEIPDHAWRNDRQRPLLPGIRPQHLLRRTPPAVLRLRVRLPPGDQRRSAARQCRAPR